jgi:DNA invertase Pin-like site-specific DNA recombinase
VVVDPAPGGTITLSERQGRLLEALVRRSTAPQRLVRRAQTILMLAAGKTFNQVVRTLGVLRHTVYKWCNRQTVALAPQDLWLFIVDNLNTH